MPDVSTKRKSPVVPMAIAAVALIAVLIAVLTGGGDDADDTPTVASSGGAAADPDRSASEEPWEQLARRVEDDPMALGDVDAPVVMLAYSEFQCPFCGKFARDTEPTLLEKYVDTGVMRIEWRDFPYLGPESTTAAQGGRAAAAQGKFWEYHDAMYEDQLPPNSGELTEDYLVGVASGLGLDVEQFRDDLSAPQTRQGIEQDFAEGQQIGVTGTPAFVINGIPVIGAQPLDVFEQTIESAASQAAGS